MKSVYSYALPMLVLAVMALFQPSLSAPHQRVSLADLADAFDKPPVHKFYLPIEIAPAALVGAFKAHARYPGHGGSETTGPMDVPLDLIQQKRTTSSLEIVDPLSADALEQEPSIFSGMKRKMFWSPLGYMPASARAQNGGGKNSGAGRNSAQDANGSNVFRYG